MISNMISKNILILSILLVSKISHGDDFQLFYKKNEYNLSQTQKQDIANRYGTEVINYFYVEAYADDSGTAYYNKWISQKRAEAIRDYLFQALHVPFERILYVGRGKDETLHSQDQKRRGIINTSHQLVNNFNITNRSIASEVESTNKTQNNIEPTAAESHPIKKELTIQNTTTDIKASDSLSNQEQEQLLITVNKLNQRVDELEKKLVEQSKKEEKYFISNQKQTQNSNQNQSDLPEQTNLARSETKRKIDSDYKFELNINSYQANEAGKYSSSSFVNDLATNPRFSLDLIIKRNFIADYILFFETGLRWNSYSKDNSLNIAKDWNNFAIKTFLGLEKTFKTKYKNTLSFGLDQILSHQVDGIGNIIFELQPVIELNYNLLVEIYKKQNHFVELGPLLGTNFGLSDIKNGFLWGLLAKYHFAENNKYHIQLRYENLNFKEDLRKLNLQTLELGFGFKF